MLLNTRSGEVEAEFHQYVQPQENPVLSDFCKQLTGISQVHCLLLHNFCSEIVLLYNNTKI